MPMEGQWARAHAPVRSLTRRERRAFVVTTAVVLVLAVAVVVWAIGRGGDAAPGRGCVDEFTGSTMGAARVRLCGADAARACRRPAAPVRFNEALSRACSRAGYGPR